MSISFFVFTNHIKHDRLITETKQEDIQSYGGLCSENKFFGKQHTDHQKIQRNETAGACGQNRYQYAEPFQD